MTSYFLLTLVFATAAYSFCSERAFTNCDAGI